MNIVNSTKISGYCLVTGSSRGIGKAIALEWASKGVPVIAVANDIKSLTTLKSEIESTYGVDCLTINKDLLKLESPKEIYASSFFPISSNSKTHTTLTLYGIVLQYKESLILMNNTSS